MWVLLTASWKANVSGRDLVQILTAIGERGNAKLPPPAI